MRAVADLPQPPAGLGPVVVRGVGGRAVAAGLGEGDRRRDRRDRRGAPGVDPQPLELRERVGSHQCSVPGPPPARPDPLPCMYSTYVMMPSARPPSRIPLRCCPSTPPATPT